ncbi:SocA family protein [Corynebacterium lizhenjunii]|uniref:SocA family protein n=1 Tax=Corynebacterium lizhenjunii TaxID=2709394 RepID=A0A7T0PAW2_9CORY|nr:type II toxin-antitoxin system antitoxin SocA domain-containing protein [Corynebacterium lizhenjunii]QPK79516.1 SocA family protein [Corynebacterium lizhenjunii]
MANIYDVGQLITELIPNVDKMKLYKLCFFSQGWHLAWTGKPLFPESLLAWSKGPVPSQLRDRTEPVVEGLAVPHVPGGQSENLSRYERDVIQNVVEFYGHYSSPELSDLSHGKSWAEARRGLPDSAHSLEKISVTTILEEFTDQIHSDTPTPTAPPLSFDLPPLDMLLELTADVENDWHDTFELLATR